VRQRYISITAPTFVLLPNTGRDEVLAAEYFVAQHLQIVRLIVVDRYPERAALCKQPAKQVEPITNE
jgi:hypothetical protein